MFTLGYIKTFKPCSSGWETFIRALGTADETLEVSLGDIAKACSHSDLMWSLRLLKNPKDRVRAVFPAVLRTVPYMKDQRSKDAVEGLKKWLEGEEVDLKAIRDSADSATNAAIASSKAAFCAADTANTAYYAAEAARAASFAAEADEAAYASSCAAIINATNAAYYTINAAYYTIGAAADATERRQQVADIISLFPPLRPVDRHRGRNGAGSRLQIEEK